MHRVRISLILLVICTLVVGAGSVGAAPERAPQARPLADAVGTGFTYQGQLKRAGEPLTDDCNFQFSLWDSLSGGSQVGTTDTRLSLPVTGGLFTIEDLNFGSSAFSGEARWLEIGVQCTGDPDYVPLDPRQPITPAPYALYAPEAGEAESALVADSATSADAALSAPWSGLTGVPAGFADNTDDVGSGSVTSVATGAGLTGGPITGSGTISLATGGVASSHIANGTILAEDLFDGTVMDEIIDDDGAGSGLDADLLDGQHAPYFQRALSGTCSPGSSIRQVNPDGSVICETDDDTIYTNGPGLLLAADQFSANFTLTGGENGTAASVARGDHVHDARYVNAGEALSISSGMIASDAVTGTHVANGSLSFSDWSASGCASGQIPRWNGSVWLCVDDEVGTVTSVSTGSGLSGGPITVSGTISIQTGGVTSSHIADGTITPTDLLDMTALNEILDDDGSGSLLDADFLDGFHGSDLQRRVASSCTAGSSIRVVNVDGTVSCETDDVGTGTVTSVGTGSGLTGGPITGSGTISIGTGGVTSTHILDETITNFDIQNGSVIFADWYHNGCSGGHIPQFNGSAWGCVANSTGTVTAVTAGSGLSGGTITTTGTIAIGTNAVTSSHIADGTITPTDLADGTALGEINDDDGHNSGLDADMLDGLQGSAYAPATHAHSSLNASDGTPSNSVYVDSEGHVGLGTMTPGSDVLSVNGPARVSGQLTLPFIYNYGQMLTGLAPGNYRDIAIETITGPAFYLASTYNSYFSPNTKLRAWVWAEALNDAAPSWNQNKYWVRVENIGTEICSDYDYVEVIKFVGYQP